MLGEINGPALDEVASGDDVTDEGSDDGSTVPGTGELGTTADDPAADDETGTDVGALDDPVTDESPEEATPDESTTGKDEAPADDADPDDSGPMMVGSDRLVVHPAATITTATITALRSLSPSNHSRCDRGRR